MQVGNLSLEILVEGLSGMSCCIVLCCVVVRTGIECSSLKVSSLPEAIHDVSR